MKLHRHNHLSPTATKLLLAGWLTIAWAACGLGQNPVAPSSVALSPVPYDSWIALAKHDANLHDLVILSEDHVLAVGDRGLIIRSDSSGRNWETLDSSTTANLHGIRFSSLGFGLAVGGWVGADTRMSHAVLLRSDDGGRQWQAVPTQHLPRLTGLRVQENRCLAWGDYSPQWRTSLFESLDGGLTWRGVQRQLSGHQTPLPIGHATAAELANSGQVGVIDSLGRAYIDASTSPAEDASLATITEPNRPLRGLHFTGSNWIACGAYGELITSPDGSRWIDAVVPLSPAAQRLCHWQAISQIGERVWVCGQPGSIVLTSEDRGTTWQVRHTGQTLPLSAIEFVDQNRGWATGPMGLVLATRDGGQSWYAQRNTARRLGMLAVSRDWHNVPWAPLAAAAWDEQIAVAATVYHEVDPIEEANFLPSVAVAQRDLAPQINLVGADHVPLLESTDQVLLGKSTEQLVEQLAVHLRCWRPDVVLLGQVSPDVEPVPQPIVDWLGQTSLRQALPLRLKSLEIEALAALKLSAEIDAAMSQELDLPAWSVSKLASTCEPERGQYSEQSGRLLRTPGISIWDCLIPLSLRDRSAAKNTSMRTIWSQSQAKSSYNALLGAIPASYETQRKIDLQNIGNFQLVMGRVHRDRSIEQLAQTPVDDRSMGQWSSDLDFLIRSVPARECGAVLQGLANRLNATHDWPQRQVVYQRLIELAPYSDTADWARLDQLALSLSDESLAWRRLETRRDSGLQRSNRSLQSVSDADLGMANEGLASTGKTIRASAESWNATPFGEVKRAHGDGVGIQSAVVAASAALPIFSSTPQTFNANVPHAIYDGAGDSTRIDASTANVDAVKRATFDAAQSLTTVADDGWQRLLHLAHAQAPALLARPDLELRQFRSEQSAQQYAPEAGIDRLRRLSESRQLIGWPQMAQQELALQQGRASELRWAVRARSTDQPPLLDGNLNEPFWQNADVMELSELDAPSSDSPEMGATQPQPAKTLVRWSFDHEYLYVGIVAPRTGGSPPPPVERRSYDADLEAADHVQLTFDTDRDYYTAIELGIAADGRTYDRCCGYVAYNPKWHVSVRSQPQQWTAELAIELADLTCQSELQGTAWAVSARRLQPNQATQSWSRLRTHVPYLHAGGLLLFGADADMIE